MDVGWPAFPVPQEGMTLRDWFAGQALAGVCAALSDERTRQMLVDNAKAFGIKPKAAVARAAYEYANEMIAARGLTEGQ